MNIEIVKNNIQELFANQFSEVTLAQAYAEIRIELDKQLEQNIACQT